MDVALLRSYADQGMTKQQIAEAVGLSYSRVHTLCQRNGIKTRRPDTKGKRPLKDSVRKTLELRENGMSYREIAKQLNIPVHRVANACQNHNAGGAMVEQRLTESQVADIVSRSGFDYVCGYQMAKKPITVRCRDCGRTFERQFHIFRDVVNGTWECNNACPLCRSDEVKENNRKRQVEKEKEKAEKEYAARIIAEFREKEKAAQISRQLERRLAMRICKNCGIEYSIVSTGYDSEKYCSGKCAKRWAMRVKNDRRLRKLKNRKHDNDISLEKLFKRDSGKCYLCGRLCDWSDGEERDGTFIAGNRHPSIDHVIPVAKGGTHTWDNIKLACRECNTLKRDL